MPSHDHLLNGQQFFHGTPSKLRRGHLIEPRGGYSYFSSTPEDAASWGQAKAGFGNKSYVYRVHPLDKYEADPDSDATVSSRTKGKLRVLGRHK